MLRLAVLWAGSCYDLPLICLVVVLFWMSGWIGLVWLLVFVGIWFRCFVSGCLVFVACYNIGLVIVVCCDLMSYLMLCFGMRSELRVCKC